MRIPPRLSINRSRIMSAVAGSKYNSLSHPPHLSRLESSTNHHAIVEHLQIEVADGYPHSFVPGYLHLPPGFTSAKDQSHHRTAAILLSGAGGGVVGPASIYLSLACKLASLPVGIPTLRLDFRYPARNKPCCNDVLAAMKYLEDVYSLNRFVLVGWSFGGAPVFTAGGQDQRVVGCATVASQTAETEGIRKLSPRPVLLLHGTGDVTLSDYCSRRLYDMYGSKGDRRLELFDGDNHALTGHARQAEALLGEFIARCAGVSLGEEERKGVFGVDLVDDRERRALMEQGGDLRGDERTE